MHNVKTGYINTEGDTLYYEVRGEGEALLMIAGGDGDGGAFRNVTDMLAGTYQVITYDRRGSSRSTRNEPQNFDVGQHVRDAIAVMKAAGHGCAHILSTSGGSIIAFELAKNHKDVIKTMVVHEPPVVRMLPEADALLAKFASIYSMAYNEGYGKAMEVFMNMIVVSPSLYTSYPGELMERSEQNNEFSMKMGLIPTVNYKPDIEAIKNNNVKIVMAAGSVTLEAKAFYGMTAVAIAELLHAEMAVFPGHHLSYIDMPGDWAAKLIEILQGK